MMHAGSLAAANWWGQPRRQGPAWIENYQNSLHTRQRTALVDLLRPMAPETIFELGCHCGPNLIRLAQELPSITEAFGLDANPEAVKAGAEWATRLGLSARVQMRVGIVPRDTEQFESGCADVVFSCYTLAYLSPPDVDVALYEMGRLAAKAVVIAEPMLVDGAEVVPPYTRVISGYQEWAHDYVRRLPWVGSLRGWTVRSVPLTPPVDHLNALLVVERP